MVAVAALKAMNWSALVASMAVPRRLKIRRRRVRRKNRRRAAAVGDERDRDGARHFGAGATMLGNLSSGVIAIRLMTW